MVHKKIFFLPVFLFHALAVANVMPLEDFAPTTITQVPRPLQRSVEFSVSPMGAFGFKLMRPLSIHRRFFGRLLYAAESRFPQSAEYQKTALVAVLDYKEEHIFELTSGVEQRLFINSKNTWALFLGASVGVRNSQYSVTFFPELCTLICGFDPNNPSGTDRVNDWSAIGNISFGVELYDFHRAGVLADITAYVVVPVTRWPKEVEILTPEGNNITPFTTNTTHLLLSLHLNY